MSGLYQRFVVLIANDEAKKLVSGTGTIEINCDKLVPVGGSFVITPELDEPSRVALAGYASTTRNTQLSADLFDWLIEIRENRPEHSIIYREVKYDTGGFSIFRDALVEALGNEVPAQLYLTTPLPVDDMQRRGRATATWSVDGKWRGAVVTWDLHEGGVTVDMIVTALAEEIKKGGIQLEPWRCWLEEHEKVVVSTRKLESDT